jgi:hypothetical protein
MPSTQTDARDGGYSACPKHDVLIVHSDFWPGVARLPAVLHDGGARVTVMAPLGSYLLSTRFATESIVVPPGVDAIADVLRLHLHTRTYRLVIIADDPLLNALAKRAPTEPWIRDILPVRDERSVEMLASKLTFLDRCRDAGLPIAESENVSGCGDALCAAARISYPVMLKLPTGHGGGGVMRIDTPDDMQREFAAFARGRTIVIERFIAGHVGGCEALFDRGRPICWSPFVTRRSDTEFGSSTARKLYMHPKLRDIVLRVGALTEFDGFGVLDFIYDEVRDDIVLLELNFRPGPGTHMRGRIRKMFTAGFSAWLRSEPSRGRETHGLDGKIVAFFPQDVHRAISHRDPWSFVLALLRGEALRDAPFDDLPLLACHLRGLAERFARPLQKATRLGRLALKS